MKRLRIYDELTHLKYAFDNVKFFFTSSTLSTKKRHVQVITENGNVSEFEIEEGDYISLW